jgi:hypothetical protein
LQGQLLGIAEVRYEGQTTRKKFAYASYSWIRPIASTNGLLFCARGYDSYFRCGRRKGNKITCVIITGVILNNGCYFWENCTKICKEKIENLFILTIDRAEIRRMASHDRAVQHFKVLNCMKKKKNSPKKGEFYSQ